MALPFLGVGGPTGFGHSAPGVGFAVGRKQAISRENGHEPVAASICFFTGGSQRTIPAGPLNSAMARSPSKMMRLRHDRVRMGPGDFVNEVLAKAQEDYEKRYRLASMGLTVDDVAMRVAQLMEMPVEQIWLPGKRRALVQARSLLCFWSVRELGVSMAALGRRLGISCTAVSHSMIRGEQIARQNNYKLIEKL